MQTDASIKQQGRQGGTTRESAGTYVMRGNPVKREALRSAGRRLNLNTQTLHLLQQTAQHFTDQHHQAYLVGGSLRNILLGEPCIDWDIAVSGNIPSLARRLADKLGGHYAYLHDKACRVVVPLNESQESGQADKEVIFDIAP